MASLEMNRISMSQSASQNVGPGVQDEDDIAALCQFISDDKVFAVFRRFDRLALRNLLHMQHELTKLEQRLTELDIQSSPHIHFQKTGCQPESRPSNNEAEKSEILARVKDIMASYHSAMLAYSQLVEMRRPTSTTQKLMKMWREGPGSQVEAASFMDLDDWRDSVALAQSKVRTGPLEEFIERYFSDHIPRKRQGTARPHSISRIRWLARAFLLLLAVASLMIPIVVLYLTRSMAHRLIIMATFSFVFAVVMTLTTRGTNQQIFLGLAAYMAVLVVFMGNDVGSGE